MLKKTVVARALSIAFSTTALAIAVVPPAMAQSNAAGSVFGKVAAGSGDTVVLKSNDTNQTRTVTLDANGGFRATSLPIGSYTGTLLKSGAPAGRTQRQGLAGPAGFMPGRAEPKRAGI